MKEINIIMVLVDTRVILVRQSENEKDFDNKSHQFESKNDFISSISSMKPLYNVV